MRKTVILLSILAFIAGGCRQAEKKQAEAADSELAAEKVPVEQKESNRKQ